MPEMGGLVQLVVGGVAVVRLGEPCLVPSLGPEDVGDLLEVVLGEAGGFVGRDVEFVDEQCKPQEEAAAGGTSEGVSVGEVCKLLGQGAWMLVNGAPVAQELDLAADFQRWCLCLDAHV